VNRSKRTARSSTNRRWDARFRDSASTRVLLALGSRMKAAKRSPPHPIRQVHMRRFPSAFVALSAIVASTTSCVIVDPSCSSGGASIFISPSVVVVAVGQSTTPRASWCRNGRYGDGSPRWSLGSTADANVINLNTSTGEITGRRVGSATVIATSDGIDGGSVSVTVR
jgi:hypothetical protein